MEPLPIVRQAVANLCSKFDHGGYALTPIIDLGALVANADGHVDQKEIEFLRYLFDALLDSQLTSDMVQSLVRSSLRVILEAGVEPRTRLIAEILLDCDAVEEGVTVALGVAFASEGLSEPERTIIESIAAAANFPKKDLASLVEKVRAASDAQPSSRRSSEVVQ